jgi:hypothetical protein
LEELFRPPIFTLIARALEPGPFVAGRLLDGDDPPPPLQEASNAAAPSVVRSFAIFMISFRVVIG